MDRVTDTLAKAGIALETLTLPETLASAAALGYPAACVGRVARFRGAQGAVTVVLGFDAVLDEALLDAALGGGGVAPASEDGGGIFGEDALWDERLLRAPVVVLPTETPGQAVKVESRRLKALNLKRAMVSREPVRPGRRSAYDVLLERGFVDRVTSEAMARERLADPDLAAYVGFDPTADSLHVGSLVPIMALKHAQLNGGRIIAIVGGGTGMIGDPSGRTDMRQMLTPADIERNMQGLRRQLSAYLEIDDNRHLMLNNADWLANKNYIEFLRDVGVHFSVNRMLAAECFRSRLERGLSFIEFNYMLLQAYDFAVLAREHRCKTQMGGSDQWGNICAGIDLARRMNNEELAGVTFPLLQSASGRKFGKSESGNVWLDASRTPPHEFFQFWRNADDLDVERFLGLFTLLPMDAVRELGAEPAGPRLNDAKKVLAFATTRLLHGQARAAECLMTAEALFGGVSPDLRRRLGDLKLLDEAGLAALEGPAKVAGLPVKEIGRDGLAAQGLLAGVLADLGFAKSRSEARRLIAQGGVTLNETKVEDQNRVLAEADFISGLAMVRVGKKKHGEVRLKD